MHALVIETIRYMIDSVVIVYNKYEQTVSS